MCLLALAYKTLPNTPLLLIGNRDEFYQRPSQGLHHWNNSSQIVAPKDLKSGGSWIGYNRHQQWIAITNYRTPTEDSRLRQSRGDIVKRYLEHNTSAAHFTHTLLETCDAFNPFNALIGDQDQLFYLSSQQQTCQQLTPGIYGLSNAHLDTPWPKVTRLKQHFSELIQQTPLQPTDLWRLLQDTTQALPEHLPQTDISPAREQLLSSIFIHSNNYGTRSSYILSQTDHLTLQERVYH